MYVDDGNLVDLQCAKGEGQSLICVLFEQLGTPTEPDKRLCLSQQNVFLGVVHDFSNFHTDGVVEFWPRERLLHKMRLYMLRIREEKQCTPAVAAKIRGTGAFMTHASCGGAGKFGMHAFKQRQYFDDPPWQVSTAMLLGAKYVESLLDDWPRRRVFTYATKRYPLVIASDAQADPGRMPTGGFIIVDPEDGSEEGYYTTFSEELRALQRGVPRYMPVFGGSSGEPLGNAELVELWTCM